MKLAISLYLTFAEVISATTDYCDMLCQLDYSRCPKKNSYCKDNGVCQGLQWTDSTKSAYCMFGTTAACPPTTIPMKCNDALIAINRIKGITTKKPTTTTRRPTTKSISTTKPAGTTIKTTTKSAPTLPQTTTKSPVTSAQTTTKSSATSAQTSTNSVVTSGQATTKGVSTSTQATTKGTTTMPKSTTVQPATTKGTTTVPKSTTVQPGTVTVPPSTGGAIKFVSYADWGEDTTTLANVVNVVKSKFSDLHHVNLLGDNFYPSGVSSTTDSQFKLFTGKVALGSLPHYLVLGNHDVLGSVDAQIQFNSVDNRWNMPSRYYSKVMQGDGFTLCAIYTDSTAMTSAQLSWLAATLASCQGPNTWRIVHGHFQIYSAGDYSDRSDFIKNLVPVLKQGKTHAYIGGHAHNQQVFNDGSMYYIVTGAACDLRHESPSSHALLKYYNSSDEGFLYTSVTASSISMQIYSAKTSSVLYQFSISP